jgi:amino acid transporter
VSITAARPADTAAEPEPDHRLGLAATIALVVGGTVGTGIFTVPAAVAE